MLKGLKDNDNETDPPAKADADAFTGNEGLKQALSNRDRFLEQHPHLRPMQAEIDRLLDASGNHHGRMAVLGTMMQGKLLEMQKELNKLSDVLLEAVTSKS